MTQMWDILWVLEQCSSLFVQYLLLNWYVGLD